MSSCWRPRVAVVVHDWVKVGNLVERDDDCGSDSTFIAFLRTTCHLLLFLCCPSSEMAAKKGRERKKGEVLTGIMQTGTENDRFFFQSLNGEGKSIAMLEGVLPKSTW